MKGEVGADAPWAIAMLSVIIAVIANILPIAFLIMRYLFDKTYHEICGYLGLFPIRGRILLIVFSLFAVEDNIKLIVLHSV